MAFSYFRDFDTSGLLVARARRAAAPGAGPAAGAAAPAPIRERPTPAKQEAAKTQLALNRFSLHTKQKNRINYY